MVSHAKKIKKGFEQEVLIPVGPLSLEGVVSVPDGARGIVVFAHGSGSSRFSPRNTFVAGKMHEAGLGTLLFDLLTEEEDQIYDNRFDIPLLAERLKSAAEWLQSESEVKGLSLSFFGSSTGAAAAIIAAADLGKKIRAVVSRGGRPDLAGKALKLIESPTLLIVGGLDPIVIRLNQDALLAMACEREMAIVPGATHLFEESGKLQEVANLAAAWFRKFS